MLMNLSSMKYMKVRKHQNSDFERCQDFEDTGKIRCLCQNGSRHKNNNDATHPNYRAVICLNKQNLSNLIKELLLKIPNIKNC